jgi:4,5-DOPA dioxygenase extradiol
MHRKQFIQSLALLPLAAAAMKLNDLGKIASSFAPTAKMPVLFLGHGSPMNAIEENEFVQGFRKLGQEIPRPNAILCISAHWETEGTFVTAMDHPKTIHDFYGFPKTLFDVEYPAPGSPELAAETKKIITSTEVKDDHAWGLDHGCWSVVKTMYPNADIPIIQMSLDYRQGPSYHYALAKQLQSLRSKGILIVGSGNLVHNLGILDWSKPNSGYDWAIEANEGFKKYIKESNHSQLMSYKSLGKAVDLSVPTPEHYLPLLYTLALKDDNDAVNFFNDKLVYGSIAMTSVKIG